MRDVRCRTNMEHLRQSMPNYGLGFEVKVVKTFCQGLCTTHLEPADLKVFPLRSEADSKCRRLRLLRMVMRLVRMRLML